MSACLPPDAYDGARETIFTQMETTPETMRAAIIETFLQIYVAAGARRLGAARTAEILRAAAADAGVSLASKPGERRA